MTLRIEEDLGMPHVLRRSLAKVSHRQVIEVLLVQQHAHTLVVEVEEVLQIGEAIGRAQRVDRREAQRDLVALGEGHHQLGLEAALDVDVQLGLGQAFDEATIVHACNLALWQAFAKRGSTRRRRWPRNRWPSARRQDASCTNSRTASSRAAVAARAAR